MEVLTVPMWKQTMMNLKYDPRFLSYKPGNIGARFHPEMEKFLLLFLGGYIIKKFEALR